MVGTCIMHAIFDDERHEIVFAVRLAEGFAGPVVEGATLGVPDCRALEPRPGPWQRPGAVLCISKSDPRRYQLYYHLRDVERREFVPTGRHYGGVVSIYPPRPPG
jgi:hypothetical protein